MENLCVRLGIKRTEVKGGKIFFSKKFGGFKFLLFLYIVNLLKKKWKRDLYTSED